MEGLEEAHPIDSAPPTQEGGQILPFGKIGSARESGQDLSRKKGRNHTHLTPIESPSHQVVVLNLPTLSLYHPGSEGDGTE